VFLIHVLFGSTVIENLSRYIAAQTRGQPAPNPAETWLQTAVTSDKREGNLDLTRFERVSGTQILSRKPDLTGAQLADTRDQGRPL
jgi:hypothetical protein